MNRTLLTITTGVAGVCAGFLLGAVLSFATDPHSGFAVWFTMGGALAGAATAALTVGKRCTPVTSIRLPARNTRIA